MSGGEGSSTNNVPTNSNDETDKTHEYSNCDKHRTTMTIMGDGTRRRKVMHAAKETLDKGEFSCRRF